MFKNLSKKFKNIVQNTKNCSKIVFKNVFFNFVKKNTCDSVTVPGAEGTFTLTNNHSLIVSQLNPGVRFFKKCFFDGVKIEIKNFQNWNLQYLLAVFWQKKLKKLNKKNNLKVVTVRSEGEDKDYFISDGYVFYNHATDDSG